jgi:hypothetical protein
MSMLRQLVVSIAEICDTTSDDFVKTLDRDLPCLTRNFKPLTAVHAMTYCPPSRGLTPTTQKNHAG